MHILLSYICFYFSFFLHIPDFVLDVFRENRHANTHYACIYRFRFPARTFRAPGISFYTQSPDCGLKRQPFSVRDLSESTADNRLEARGLQVTHHESCRRMPFVLCQRCNEMIVFHSYLNI